MKEILLLGMGGFAGTTLRYGMQQLVHKYVNLVFPLGTFLVNVSGCFLIGLFYGLAVKYQMGQGWRLLLITGLCGGYTTFSAFSYESIELFRQGNYLYLTLYLFLSVALGIAATIAGLWVMR